VLDGGVGCHGVKVTLYVRKVVLEVRLRINHRRVRYREDVIEGEVGVRYHVGSKEKLFTLEDRVKLFLGVIHCVRSTSPISRYMKESCGGPDICRCFRPRQSPCPVVHAFRLDT
jgi:hypothetical protein